MSAIAAALIGAGVAGLSNVVNGQNADEGNRWNWATAQMNNNYNMAMLNKQILYNRDMWNAQNEYNSPLNQRNRYEQAGINPYMALGNIQSGNAQSAGGVNPPSASPVAPANVPYFDGSGIQSSIQSYVANRLAEKQTNSSVALQNANAEQVRIENQFKAMDLATQLVERIENTKSASLRNAYQSMLNDTFMERHNSDMLTARLNQDMIYAGVQEKYVDLAIKEIELLNLPQQYRMQFASIAADIALKNAQEGLTIEQTAHELERKFKTISEKVGISLNNHVLRSTCQATIRRIYAEEMRSHQPQNIYQIGFDAIDGFNNFVEQKIINPSKRLWKDSKRSIGLH